MCNCCFCYGSSFFSDNLSSPAKLRGGGGGQKVILDRTSLGSLALNSADVALRGTPVEGVIINHYRNDYRGSECQGEGAVYVVVVK